MLRKGGGRQNYQTWLWITCVSRVKFHLTAPLVVRNPRPNSPPSNSV